MPSPRAACRRFVHRSKRLSIGFDWAELLHRPSAIRIDDSHREMPAKAKKDASGLGNAIRKRGIENRKRQHQSLLVCRR